MGAAPHNPHIETDGDASAERPDSAAPLDEADLDADDVDGRAKRRLRNREAVIQALLDLIREGNLFPAVNEIAERAGVSDRSLFRYFNDLGDLSREAVEHEFRAIAPLTVISDIGKGSLEHRIDQVIDVRLTIYARTHSLGRTARAQSARVPAIDESLANLLMFARHQINVQFNAELRPLGVDEAEEVVNAALAVLSLEAYDMLHRQLGMDAERVGNTWRRLLRGLFANL